MGDGIFKVRGIMLENGFHFVKGFELFDIFEHLFGEVLLFNDR
jgi:hypothetical protein